MSYENNIKVPYTKDSLKLDCTWKGDILYITLVLPKAKNTERAKHKTKKLFQTSQP